MDNDVKRSTGFLFSVALFRFTATTTRLVMLISVWAGEYGCECECARVRVRALENEMTACPLIALFLARLVGLQTRRRMCHPDAL